MQIPLSIFDMKIQVYLIRCIFENVKKVIKSNNCEDNDSGYGISYIFNLSVRYISFLFKII
jgi:hypothetical protein